MRTINNHKVVYYPLDGDGYYMADLDLIVINSSLPPQRQKYILEHELAHIEQRWQSAFGCNLKPTVA